MAEEIVINVDNSDEVLRELEAGVKRALNAVGIQAERHAKDMCPVKTGRLRGSITYATADRHSKGQPPAQQGDYDMRGKPEPKSVYIGTNVEYAAQVETGSSGRKPKPYLKPAVQNYKGEYQQIIERYLKGGS